MILTIDIGNTNITFGVYKDDELIFVSRLSTDRSRTEDQYSIEFLDILRLYNIDPNSFDGAIISCVVPELLGAIKNAIVKITGKTPLVVGPGVKTGLNILTDIPGQLGADLVCGAVAAIENYPLPCLVMDLGTATKISVIDSNKVFRGCTIAPGVEISLEALATKTSQLPHISIEKPKYVIGTNTVDSMQSGTVYGTAAMLCGLADMIEQELNEPVKSIIMTGGLGKEIAATCKADIVYNPVLILDGLKTIFYKNLK